MTWKRSMKSVLKTKKRVFILSGFAVIVTLVYLVIDSFFDGTNEELKSIIDTWGKIKVQHNAKDIYKKKMKTPSNSSSDNLPFKDRYYSDRHDNFDDLQAFIDTSRHISASHSSTPLGPAYIYVMVREPIDNYNPTLGEVLDFKRRKSTTTLELLHMKISRQHMYDDKDPLVNKILNEMAYSPIERVTPKDRGTQLKLTFEYKNGIKAMMKPMRLKRDQQTHENHYYFSDIERHNAEIAAYHLDKVLGFRRAFPIVGRKVNTTSEIYDISYKSLRKTFFTSPPPFNRTCFFGECHYYCDHHHAFCGDPDMIEGSFAAFMPEFEAGLRDRIRHPWRRSYSATKKADWEDDEDYCEKVREKAPYNRGRRLLDLMDLSVFDFLIGNQDRHHYEVMKIFADNETSTVHVDHGRGFGKAFYDDMTILTPLTQCCTIRESTVKMLLKFHNGKHRLSRVLRESLLADPLAPILWEPHLGALDRRIGIILESIRNCISNVQAYQEDKKTDLIL